MTKAYDENKGGAGFVVYLCSTSERSAIFMLSSENMEVDELYKLAGKFDWKGMAKEAKTHL